MSARQEVETTLASGDAALQVCAAGEDRVNGDNIRCLQNGKWLLDEVINVWLALVKRSSDASCHGGPGSPPRIYIIHNTFYTRLTEGVRGYDYEWVDRWTKRSNVADVFDHDLILVPIHLPAH